jgi:hypothetical protein
MIIYHPRSDIYHCMFRFITIASLQELEEFDFTRLRIYDLFFLFPHLVNDISFPRLKGVSEIKKKAAGIQKPYETLPDKKRLFSEMGDYHIQALQILVSKDIFGEVDGKLRLSSGFYSEPITRLLTDNQYNADNFFGELVTLLNQVNLAGEAGLKKRTGLMEYRYDAV